MITRSGVPKPRGLAQSLMVRIAIMNILSEINMNSKQP